MIITNIASGQSGGSVITIETTFPAGSVCTCSNGSKVLNGGTSGSCVFKIPSAGEWTVSCTDGTESDSEIVTIDAITKSCVLKYWDPAAHQRVGGRIFYIGSSTNTYTIYTYDGTVLTDYTVDGLASAYYYDKSGSAADKFYVVDTADGMASSKTWQTVCEVTGYTSNSIGSGKRNTNSMLSRSDKGTAFTWIQSLRNNNSQGCNDWFIGSMAEIDQLYNVRSTIGVASWFSSAFWSSVEPKYTETYDNSIAWGWGLLSYGAYGWANNTKYKSYNGVFALRAF